MIAAIVTNRWILALMVVSTAAASALCVARSLVGPSNVRAPWTAMAGVAALYGFIYLGELVGWIRAGSATDMRCGSGVVLWGSIAWTAAVGTRYWRRERRQVATVKREIADVIGTDAE